MKTCTGYKKKGTRKKKTRGKELHPLFVGQGGGKEDAIKRMRRKEGIYPPGTTKTRARL